MRKNTQMIPYRLVKPCFKVCKKSEWNDIDPEELRNRLIGVKKSLYTWMKLTMEDIIKHQNRIDKLNKDMERQQKRLWKVKEALEFQFMEKIQPYVTSKRRWNEIIKLERVKNEKNRAKLRKKE